MNSKRHTLTTIFLLVIIFSTTQTILAKSVYVINNTNTSQMQAYKINGTALTYQTDYDFVSKTWGSVGIAINESDYGAFLFVTFEWTGEIEIVNAKTMEYVDTVIATNASDLAGIIGDKGKSKIYIIDRESNHLYVYSWNPMTKQLTLDIPYPYYVELQDCYKGYGLALDEENGRLYVGDNTNRIKYYDTNDPNWSKVGEVNVTCNVISVALDVNNQLLYYGSMGDYGEGDPCLYKYNISSHTESSVDVGCSVAGIAVDQSTGLIYLTTYGGGANTYYPDPPNDRLMVYNSNLVKQQWESGDIGNPTGVAVGTTAAYKQPLFYLEKVDVNEPNCASFDDYITYRITYGPNSCDHNNVVLTDFLPSEVDYVSSDPCGTYNPYYHTVTWNIGNLDANDPCDSVTLTVKVDKCAESDGIITNYCQIESDIGRSNAEYVTYLCSASNPGPACGEIVGWDINEFSLTWCPGHFAADVNGHEVYFGTNFNDVNDANNSWPIGEVYRGKVNNPSYPLPLGSLDKGTTYYWRIDEVNTAHLDLRWRGGVWSFTTGNYFVVENFDSYADSDALRVVWKEGSPIAEVSLNTDLNYVRDGNSMQYHYDNYWRFYSEAYANTTGLNSLPSGIGKDWTSGGVKALELYFYGQAGNDANEQMYVKLTDGNTPAKTAKVIYDGDMNDIRKEQWHEWNIALTEFTDVNLANVARITIGFGDGNDPSPAPNPAGTVYFDDIRLYLERCIPGYYPAGDFDSDCDVDFYDFAIFALAWLTNDPNISLDDDNDVDIDDLSLFCDNWLWQEGGATSMSSGFSEALYASAPPEQPQIELQPEPEPQPQVQSEPELLQPEPELQPEPQPEPELQPEPQPQPEPPQPEPQPEQQQSMLAGPNETPGIWLVYDGNMTPSPGDEITVYIHSDPMLFCLGMVVEVTGDANITTAMSEADCNNYGWDNGWNSDPYIDPAGWLYISGVSWESVVNGTVGYFKFRYNSGEVTVSVTEESCAYDAYCQPVLFSPQPLIFGRDPNEQ